MARKGETGRYTKVNWPNAHPDPRLSMTTKSLTAGLSQVDQSLFSFS